MDDTVTTPAIKSTKISASKMMGREVNGDSVSVEPESKIGKLSRILRTTRIKVNKVEDQTKDHDKRIKLNAEKITRIKNILKTQKSDLAEKLSNMEEGAELASVEQGLDEIIKTLQKERKAEEKAAEAARRKREKDRAKSREKQLEGGLGKGINKVVGTVVKPFKSIFDKIFGFLLNVLLGRTVIKLIEWFGNKENQGKIETLIRFVKDWWPALTAAVLLFGTGFGALAGGLVGIVTAFIPKLIALSAGLLAAIAKNPFAIGAGLFAAGAVIPAVFPQTVTTETDAKVNKSVEEQGGQTTAEALKQEQKDREKNQNPFMKFLTGTVMGEDAERAEQIQRAETGEDPVYKNKGGFIPRGTDVIPAMLSPGEFVMSRGAVDKFGADTLASMNAMGGGTNNPKDSSGVTYARGGGMMGGPSFAEHSSDHRHGAYSSGSLMTDPFGALDRILGQQFGVRMSGKKNQEEKATTPVPASEPPPIFKGKQETSDDQTGGSIPAKMLGSATFRDSGLLYLRSMLGGLGGRITEQDLSMASKEELSKAIARAKKRSAQELRIAEQQLAEAKTKGFNRQVLAERQSVVDRLKRGEVRVEYEDYYDGTKITPAAEDAKSILGKFWAAATDNGGYEVVNERYDFVDMKDPLAVLMGDSSGVAEKAKPGQPITLRQRLQAMHQLNPFARDMAVDMVIGEKPTRERSMNNVMSKIGGIATYFGAALNPAMALAPVVANALGGPKPSEQKQEQQVKPSKPPGVPMTQSELLNAQRYAESKGKYFSSTDGKTYASYQDALNAQRPKPAQISKSQRQLTPAIGPPVKPQPKVEFMDIVDKFNRIGQPTPSGRNTIPPFAAATSGSKPKTDLLGLLTVSNATAF